MAALTKLTAAEECMRGGLSTFAPSSFRNIRRRARLSTADVAIALGVSSSTVNKWESGVTAPRAEHLLALAELFQRPTSDFLRLPKELSLRHLREVAGLTVVQVGEMAGKTAATITRIEGGSIRPTPAVLDVMAQAYGVTAQEILETWDRDVERTKVRARRAAER